MANQPAEAAGRRSLGRRLGQSRSAFLLQSTRMAGWQCLGTSLADVPNMKTACDLIQIIGV